MGSTRNRGIEFHVDGDILKGGKVEWSSGVNYSYGTTELTVLSDDVFKASYVDLYAKPSVGSSEYFFRLQEGGTVGQFWGYEYAESQDGQMMIYTDTNEIIPESEADDSYKRYIGNGAPTSFLSWSNTIRYKNFDLNVLFTGAFGFEIFNMRKYGMGLQGCGTDNVLREAYLSDSDVITGGGVISSYFLESGNYLKLDNLTLGYNFNLKSKIVDNLRIFLSAKNLHTFTKYTGNDPSIVPVTGLTPGIDLGSSYPEARQYTVGLSLNFK
ncbi:MAG: hypothetical protein SNG81_10215 [Rikenellaceae bacterium]